jgi:hypothetical protein
MDTITREARLLELERYRHVHKVLEQQVLPKVVDLPRTADAVILILHTIEHNVADILRELGVS